MTNQPLSALKEWDVQCQLLTQGTTNLLIRKGGIMETHDGFEVEHKRFLLYPTFLHQNPEELRSEFHNQLRDDPQPGHIQVPALAEVVAVHKVENLEQALALEPQQALTAAAIQRRFEYRKRPWVHALLLRVKPLIQPLKLEETSDMLGCISWVPLSEQQFKVGEAVQDEATLKQRQEQLAEMLAS